MSTSGAGGPRHAGRIVDPLAREDSDGDTDTGDGIAPPGVAADGDQSPSRPSQRSRSGSHTVRERLLAKAELARAAAFDEASGQASELDDQVEPLAATNRPPSAPSLRLRRAQLSPAFIAVFGTLMGVATVASLVALAMNLDHAPASLQQPSASTTPKVSSQPAAASKVPKRQRKKLPGPWRIADDKNNPTLRISEGEIGTQSFLRAVMAAGIEAKQVYRVLTALKDLKNLDRCERSDRFVALSERGSGRIKAFEYVVNKEEIYQAREGADGLLHGEKLDLKVAREQVRGAVVYTGAKFDDDMQRAGFEPSLYEALGMALEGHLALDQLERGDVLRVVAQELTVLGEFSRYAGIEAVEYRSARGDEAPLRVYYFRGPKSRGYFDQKGRALYEGGWRKPIKDAPITSRFNPKRLHPLLKKIMPHTGTDFGAPAGTPVGASSFGTVSFMGWAGPSGNLLKIDHAGGIETSYAHLSRFAEGLKTGDKVKRMQIIGYVGSTGRSTGPHLHFSAKKEGHFIDAETLNLDGMRVLPADERAAFDQMRKIYDALLDAIELPARPGDLDAEAARATERRVAPAAADASGAHPLEKQAAPPPAGGSKTAESAPPRPPPASSAAVHLTDEELMKLQPATDEGEVEE